MWVRRHFGHRLARLAVTALSVGLAAGAATIEPDSPRLPDGQQTCPEGAIADIQPQDAIIARLSGKDARIFIQSCLAQGPASRTPECLLLAARTDRRGRCHKGRIRWNL